jgi:hypothetical protein
MVPLAVFISASTLRNLTNILLFLGSATQLGLHFWPDSAFVSGVRVDYLSPTIFATDLLLLTWFLLVRPPLTNFRPLMLLGITSLLFSALPLQALIWWIRLMFWVVWISTLTLTWLRHHLPIILIFFTTLVVLGFSQVLLGRSLQGIFYLLGERQLSLGGVGVATQLFFSEVILRAYATFSHPNIFAGWGILVTILLSLISRSSISRRYSLALGFLTLLLTASRSALLGLSFWIMSRQRSIKLLLPILFIVLFFARPDDNLSERFLLLVHSINLTSLSPIFGHGALGSLTLPQSSQVSTLRLFQPDHFSPTLLLSWFGIVGALQLTQFIPKLRLKHLLPLLPLLVFDHYLLTSHSGLAIALIYLHLMPQLD